MVVNDGGNKRITLIDRHQKTVFDAESLNERGCLTSAFSAVGGDGMTAVTPAYMDGDEAENWEGYLVREMGKSGLRRGCESGYGVGFDGW